jgi:4-hydroxy-2-oxoglutarate aldolase
MSSATIEAIMKRAPNLCGVKLTCGGSIEKLLRLNAAIFGDPSINNERPFPFILLDGFTADLIPWVHSGGHGTVSGIPNYAPLAGTKLWKLCSKPNPTDAEKKEAARIQIILSTVDVAAVPGGIRAMSETHSLCRGPVQKKLESKLMILYAKSI